VGEEKVAQIKEMVTLEDYRKARQEVLQEWKVRQPDIDQVFIDVSLVFSELLKRRLFGLERTN
jgi:hypothetical protein